MLYGRHQAALFRGFSAHSDGIVPLMWRIFLGEYPQILEGAIHSLRKICVLAE